MRDGDGLIDGLLWIILALAMLGFAVCIAGAALNWLRG